MLTDRLIIQAIANATVQYPALVDHIVSARHRSPDAFTGAIVVELRLDETADTGGARFIYWAEDGSDAITVSADGLYVG